MREGFLVLEFGREVDAVVLADVADGLGRQFLGLGRDAHGIEDMSAGGQITSECTGRDTGQLGQCALADEFVLVVEVNHITILK